MLLENNSSGEQRFLLENKHFLRSSSKLLIVLSDRSLEFGVPHHSVVSCMEPMYIYISLTSVAVEVEESQFHDVR